MIRFLFSLLIAIFGFIGGNIVAAQDVPQWAVATSFNANPTGGTFNKVKIDRDGFVYIAGSFAGSFSLGSTALESAGGNDAYIIKLTPDFVPVWARSIGSAGNDFGLELAVDTSGNVYVSGQFEQTLIAGEDTLVSFGSTDAFLVKYSPVGTPQWLRGGGSSVGDAEYNFVTLDPFQQPVIVGQFCGSGIEEEAHDTAHFDGMKLGNLGLGDIFLVKYDVDGNIVLAKSYGSNSSENPCYPYIDQSGNIYLTGHFSSYHISFDAIDIDLPTTISGTNCGFITKLDSDGIAIWAKPIWWNFIGEVATVSAVHVYTDALSNVYVLGGHYGATVQFGGGITVPALGSGDMFLAKYSPEGVPQWAQVLGWYSIDDGSGLITDAAGNSYVTGSFNQRGWYGTDTLTGPPGQDVYVAKFNTNGESEWAISASGTGSEIARDIAMDAAGNLYCVGVHASSPTTFGDISLMAAVAPRSAFVAKLSQPVSVPEVAAGDRQLKLYPNPAGNQLSVELPRGQFTCLTVTDITGRRVAQQALQPSAGQLSFDCTQLPAGIYTLEASGKSTRAAALFTIQH